MNRPIAASGVATLANSDHTHHGAHSYSETDSTTMTAKYSVQSTVKCRV